MSKENSIHALLSVVIKNLKAPKGQYNKFGKYKYRSCEDILEGVKAVLPNGCSVNLNDDIVCIADRVYVKSTASFCDEHGNSVSSTGYAREEISKKGMDSSQVTGAASSYARKYALNGLFCIDDTKDADSQDNSDKSATEVKQNPEIKMLSDEERKMLDDAINKSETMADLKLGWSNVNAAKKRMSEEDFKVYEIAKNKKKEMLDAK